MQNRTGGSSTVPSRRRRASAPGVETNSISTLYAHVRAGVVGAVVAHTWLHLYPVPAGMRAVPLVWPDDRAEPLPTRASITTVREVDLVAVLDRSAASGR